MKKLKRDPRYLRISFYVFLTGAALLVLWKVLTGDWSLMENVGSFLTFLWKAVATVATGLIIAYILLPAVEGFEKLFRKLFKKKPDSKAIKPISIAIVYVLLITMIVLAGVFIIPGVVQNIIDLANNLPDYYKTVEQWYVGSVKDSEIINNEYTQNAIDNAVVKIDENLNQWIISALSGLASFIYRFIVSIFKGLLAIILSIYFMTTRKNLKEGLVKTSYAYLGEKKTYSVRTFLRSVDWVFGKYISAKLIQLIIIFIITQIIFIFLKVPYSTLMSAIVAITNVVPYVGPIVGMIPPIIISLLQSPIKALWVFLSMMALQIADGNLLQPLLIGDKMGLSPFWVLVAVIVGGGLFGIWGIILSVPVAAVIKILVRQYVKRVEKKKEMDADIKGD